MKTHTLATLLFIAGQSTLAHAADNDKLTLLLDWFINPDHAAIIVAQERGIFKNHQLDVEIIEPADPSLPPKLVASEKADMAVDYQPQLQMRVANGLPLVRIASLFNRPLNSMVVLDDSGITDLRQLKGKKIGYSVSGLEQATINTMLNHVGLSNKDVELINVNWALSPSLLSKKVDTVNGAFRNFELNQLALEGVKAHAFFPENYGVPLYDELVIVAHKKQINQDKFKRFVAALNEASRYIKANPSQAWNDFVQYNPNVLDTELNRRAWKDTVPYMSEKPSALNSKQYADFAEFLLKNQLIEQSPKVQDYTIEYSFKGQ